MLDEIKAGIATWRAMFGADFPFLLEALGGELDFVAAKFLIERVDGADDGFFSRAVFQDSRGIGVLQIDLSNLHIYHRKRAASFFLPASGVPYPTR